MLPDFEQREVWPNNEPHPYRVLAFDIYDCEEPELYDRFVYALPNVQRRSEICDGFLRLRSDACRLGFRATQWVDGSFISTKIDPGDIDVVTFVDYDAINSLDNTQDHFAANILNGGESTKPAYDTHTFLAVSCEANHPYFPVFEGWRQYWLDKWGKTRVDKNTGSKEPKGFLKMTLGNAPHPHISK